MQAIADKKIAGGASALIEHGRGYVDVCSVVLGAQKILDQLVCLLHFRPGAPAQNRRLDRDHEYPSFRQLGMDDLYELMNVLRDVLRRLAYGRGQVVIYCVHHDGW